MQSFEENVTTLPELIKNIFDYFVFFYLDANPSIFLKYVLSLLHIIKNVFDLIIKLPGYSAVYLILVYSLPIITDLCSAAILTN